MNDEKKGGYSADERKLRPRRPRISRPDAAQPAYRSSETHDEGHRSYDENRPRYSGHSGYRPQRPAGEGRPYGPARPYGEGRPQRSFREDRPQRFSGEDRPQRSFASDRPRRSFSEGRPPRYSGEDRPQRFSGEDRPLRFSGEDRPRRPAGERRPYGPARPYGEGRPQRGYSAGRPGPRPAPDRAFRKGPAPARSGKRNGPRFNEAPDSGIGRMLSRKPMLDQMQLSDNDTVAAPIPEEIRLNKFIANSGVCSRREADQLIQAGVVTVNGVTVTELGTKVNVLKDEIRFNGEHLKGEPKVYIVMNKPRGFVTTAGDPHADKTVMDLLRGCQYRVFPVGRLDKNTTGVLMLTNDGDVAEKLTHPSYDKKKIYQVILDRPLSEEDRDKILVGITLGDGDIRADELEFIEAEDHRKLGIEIHSGKNRIVRRIFESLGYEVKALDRVYFAGLTKKGLKKGEWRYLSEGESNILRMGAYV